MSGFLRLGAFHALGVFGACPQCVRLLITPAGRMHACIQIRQLVEDNFLIWGPIKRLYMVHLKTLAFVEYEWRSSAEFAKEAMCKQGLKGSTQVRSVTAVYSACSAYLWPLG